MIRYVRFILAIPLLLFIFSCSTQQTSTVGNDPELEGKARAALQNLSNSAPRAKTLLAKSMGVLVFPDIDKAGFIVGAQAGNGVMFDPNGQVVGYYNVSAVSYGLQAGAQSFSQAMFFMTDSALSDLNDSDGLSVGVGPSVVVVDEGIGKSLTTENLTSDLYVFIFGQQGLMAGLGVQGQKITKLNK